MGLFRHWALVQIWRALKVKTFKLIYFVSRVLSWFCIVKCSTTKFGVCFHRRKYLCVIFVWQVASMQLALFCSKERRCSQLFEGIRNSLKGIQNKYFQEGTLWDKKLMKFSKHFFPLMLCNEIFSCQAKNGKFSVIRWQYTYTKGLPFFTTSTWEICLLQRPQRTLGF